MQRVSPYMFTSLLFEAGTFDGICLFVGHQRYTSIEQRTVLLVTFFANRSPHSKPRRAASVLAP